LHAMQALSQLSYSPKYFSLLIIAATCETAIIF
jgi:hypothetical protein